MQKTILVRGQLSDKFNKGSIADRVNEVLKENQGWRLESAVPIAANNVDSTLLLVLAEQKIVK